MNIRVIAIFIFFCQVIFSFASYAIGGNGWVETGNGGFVMDCPNRAGKLLDLHEGDTQLSLSMDQSAETLKSVKTRVNFLISRLSQLDPYRGTVYKRWFRNFFNETTFIEDQRLYPIPDVGFTYIPKECHLELAVFQRKPDFRTKYRYTINYDVWNGLDNMNKAALVMHELIYREASSSINSHGTSEYTRYFNAWLHSEEFATITLQQFIQRVQQLNLQQASYNGFNLKLGSYNLLYKQWDRLPVEFYMDGSVKQASISSLSKEAVSWVKPIANCFADGMRLADDQMGAIVNFSPTGELEKIELSFLPNAQCVYPFNDGQKSAEIKGDHYTFYRDGSIVITGNTVNLEIFAIHGIPMSIFLLNQPVRYTLNSQRQLVRLRFERTLCWSKPDSTVNFYAQTPAVELNIGDITAQSLPACYYSAHP